MFYVKKKINDDTELKINLYDDEIYTTCPKCGKEMKLDTEDVKLVLRDSDFSSGILYCEECSKEINKNAEATH